MTESDLLEGELYAHWLFALYCILCVYETRSPAETNWLVLYIVLVCKMKMFLLGKGVMRKKGGMYLCVFVYIWQSNVSFHSGEAAPRLSECQDSNIQVVNAGVHHI